MGPIWSYLLYLDQEVAQKLIEEDYLDEDLLFYEKFECFLGTLLFNVEIFFFLSTVNAVK